MQNKTIACNICGLSFDSQNKQFCQKCKFYNEGLNKFGITKSNLDYQIEVSIKNLEYIAKQI